MSLTKNNWDVNIHEETTSCAGSWLLSCTTQIKLGRCVPGQAQCPKPISMSATGSCALAVDQLCLHLQDQDLIQVQSKHKVDDLAVLEGGYMVMAMRDGSLTIGVVVKDADTGTTKFVVKSSQKVVQGVGDLKMEYAFKRVMIRLTGDQVAQVITLTSTGSLIVISNIELLDGDINVRSASLKTVSVSRATKDFVICGDDLVLLGHGDTTISVYSTEDLVLRDIALQYEENDMMRIWACGSNVFFTLDTEGVLHIWNLSLLVVVHSISLIEATGGHPATDIRPMYSQESHSSFNLNNLSAAALTEESLRMIQFPTLECSFQQKVDSNSSVFLSKSPVSQDDVFVAMCSTEYDEDDDETCLSIKLVSYAETDPERRLDKLLTRKQFDDAQRLIKMYSMQFNITPYLVQHKMYNALPSLSQTQELIELCRKQINECKDSDDLITSISAELHILEYRFDVFIKVFGTKAYSPEEWQRFQHCDILDEVITHLSAQSFHKAFDLWHQFQLDMIACLKPGMVGKILHSLPTSAITSTLTDKVMDWLVVDIVPYLVWAESLTDDMESMVQWTQGVMKILESQQGDWPSNGIAMCNRMVKGLQANTLKPWDQEAGLWSGKMASTQNQEFVKTLQDTLAAMRTIHTLKTRFQCHLSLEVVRKETKESLVYRMLDKVKVVEMLPKVLTTQILPYVKYHNIKADEIFAAYIKDILQRVSHSFDSSSWQTKVQAIIDVIQAPKEKVLSVLNLVQHSTLPFANFVEGLVSSVLESVKHPLTETLGKEWQTLRTSNLLCIYELEPFNVTPDKALRVAKYFIEQGRPSAMSDAKKFLQAVGMEKDATLAQYQAMFYIEKDRLPDLMLYVKSLPRDVAKSCAEWCMGMGEMNMSTATWTHPLHPIRKASMLRFFSAGILCANVLKYHIKIEDPLELDDIERVKSKLNSALVLESKYDFGIERFDMDDGKKCVEIFKKQIEHRGHEDYAVLMRIAELLGVCREMALSCMLEHAAALKGSAESVAHLTNMLCECPYLSHSCILDTAVKLTCLEQPWLLAPARQLATQAFIHCTEFSARATGDLLSQLSLLERLQSQCQDDSKGAAVSDVGWNVGGEEDEEVKKELMEAFYGPMYNPVKMPLTEGHLQDAYLILGPRSNRPVSETKAELTGLTSQLVSYGHDAEALDMLSHVQERIHQQAATGDVEDVDNQAAQTLVNKAISKVSSRLLGKVMKQAPSDLRLCLSIALQLPQSHMLSLLNQETSSTLVNHNRLKKIFALLTAYGTIHEEEDMVSRCQSLERQEKWRNRLSKLGVSLGPSPSKKALLHAVTTLMTDNNTTFLLVQEFILDMDINLEVVHQEYESSFCSVLTQAPVSPSALGKAKSILDSISDESCQLAAIEKALPLTSEYNYEVLEFLMEQQAALLQESNRANRKSMELLKLLKDYKRKCPPCTVEEEAIITSSSCDPSSSMMSLLPPTTTTTTSSALATMAKMADWEKQQQSVRLPFRLVQSKMGKIMEAELTSATLPTWQLIASVLGSQKDRILISLATKLVTTYVKLHSSGNSSSNNDNTGVDGNNYHSSSSHTNVDNDSVIMNGSTTTTTIGSAGVEDDGEPTEEFEHLLQQLGPILLQIERRECGIWLCQATAERLNRIADKIRTLESGLTYARVWAEECSTSALTDDDSDHNKHSEEGKKAEKAINVFESKLPSLYTQRVMQWAGLGWREDLMSLINQPEQLIRRLYHLPLTNNDRSRDKNYNDNDDDDDGLMRRPRSEMNGEYGQTLEYDESVIHTVCEDIADRYNLDLLSIHTSLIDLWLTGNDASSMSNDAEQTMFNVTSDFHLDCESVNEEESIPRIVSLLNSSPNGPSHVEHLLEILCCDESGDADVTLQLLPQTLSLNSRRTAILCLFETGHASPDLRQDLRLLNQLIALQSFGISFTPEMYARVEKLPLLLRLWEKCRGQRKAMPLMGSLCLDQSPVVPAQLWNSVLLQMIKFDQNKSVRPLMMALMQMRGVEKVKQTEGFIKAKVAYSQ